MSLALCSAAATACATRADTRAGCAGAPAAHERRRESARECAPPQRPQACQGPARRTDSGAAVSAAAVPPRRRPGAFALQRCVARHHSQLLQLLLRPRLRRRARAEIVGYFLSVIIVLHRALLDGWRRRASLSAGEYVVRMRFAVHARARSPGGRARRTTAANCALQVSPARMGTGRTGGPCGGANTVRTAEQSSLLFYLSDECADRQTTDNIRQIDNLLIGV